MAAKDRLGLPKAGVIFGTQVVSKQMKQVLVWLSAFHEHKSDERKKSRKIDQWDFERGLAKEKI